MSAKKKNEVKCIRCLDTFGDGVVLRLNQCTVCLAQAYVDLKLREPIPVYDEER